MKVYIHIGSHKTGTTAIQEFAASNSEDLLARGLLYPNKDLIGERPNRSHWDYFEKLVEWEGAPRRSADIKLLYSPSYDGPSPYQKLIYDGMSKIDCASGSVDDALELLSDRDPDGPFVVLHLHRVETVLASAGSEVEARLLNARFCRALEQFVELGGDVLWTVHRDEVVGQTKFPDERASLFQAIADLARHIHVHSDRLRLMLDTTLQIPQEKILVLPLEGGELGETLEKVFLGRSNAVSESQSSDTSKPGGRDPRAFLRAARRAAQDKKCNILMSAENLFRFTPQQADKACRILYEVFARDEMIVVCTLRPQVDFLESLYRNRHRAYVAQPEPFEKWMLSGRSPYDYEGIITRFLNGLKCKPMFLPYTRETRTDFVSRFFEALGVPRFEPQSAPREKNPSLDVIDCLTKKNIIGNNASVQNSKAYNNFAFKNRLRSNYTFMDQKLAETLAEKVREGNQRLIAMDDSLEEILGDNAQQLNFCPIDEAGLKMVDDRVAQYRAYRADRKK